MTSFLRNASAPAPERETGSAGSAGERLRVLFITRDFPPVSHSGTLRSEAFARYLPEFGVDPVIFTSQADTASRVAGLDTAQVPDWEDDPRWPAVYRANWEASAPVAGKHRRLINRLPVANIMASQADRRRLTQSLLGPAREAIRRHDIRAIYASAMPSETILLAIALGREFELPVVADLRDPWTYQPILPYRHVIDFLMERRLERHALSQCERIIVNTRQTRMLVERQLGIPGSRLRLIRNGFDEEEFPELPLHSTPLAPGKFVMLHAGQLSVGAPPRGRLGKGLKRALGLDYDPLRIDARTRSPLYVLQALELLIQQHPLVREHLRLWLVGMSKAGYCDAIRQFRYPECLKVQPRVSSAKATEMTCRADLLLLLQFRYFLGGRDFCPAIPGKLYTYLRSGRRILACVQPSEIAEIVREFDAGQVVPPDDPAAIAAAIWSEYQAWTAEGVAPQPALRSLPEFDRRRLTGELARVLSECAIEHRSLSG